MWIVVAVAAVAVALLAGALVLRRPNLIAWSLAALGGEYAVWLTERGVSVDTRAPLYGAVLLLVAELAYECIDSSTVPVEPELYARRALQLAGLALAAVVVGALVLAASAVPLGGGVALTAVGVAAATLAVVTIVRMAR
jgi:hypothetical protein